MKEIKSFREYILEKSLLGEDDKETDIGETSAEEDKVNGNSSSTSNETENSESSEETASEPKSANTKPVQGMAATTNFSLKLKSSKPVEVRAQLNSQLEQLKMTFDRLDDLITARNIIDQKGDKVPINIMGGNDTFLIAKNEWLSKWNEMIKSRRTTREKVAAVETLKKRAFTKSQKEKRDEAYEKLTKEEVSENSEVLNEFSVNIAEKKKAFLDSLKSMVSRPFSSASELATGKNKYAADRVLTTAKENSEDGVYGIGESDETEFAEKMYNKFVKDARAIILKDKALGLAYLKSAEKKLKKYNNPNYYIKGSDSAYASDISRDLYRANSTLESIGYRLRELLANYRASLNKISQEIEIKDAKNQEALNSTNAEKARSNYEIRKVKASENKEKVNEVKEKIKEKIADPAKEKIKSKYNTYQEIRDFHAELSKNTYNVLTNNFKNITEKKFKFENVKEELAKVETYLKSSKKDKEKLARVAALSVFARYYTKLLDIQNSSNKNKWPDIKDFLKTAARKEAKSFRIGADPDDALEAVKENISRIESLINDANPSKKDETNVSVKPGSSTKAGARDFKDSEPAVPSDIYSYALQKAKRS